MEWKQLLATALLGVRLLANKKKPNTTSTQTNSTNTGTGTNTGGGATPTPRGVSELFYQVHTMKFAGTKQHANYKDIGILFYIDLNNYLKQGKRAIARDVTATKISFYIDDTHIFTRRSDVQMNIHPNYVGQIRVNDYITEQHPISYWNDIVKNGTPFTVNITALFIIDGKTHEMKHTVKVEDIVDYIEPPKIGRRPSVRELAEAQRDWQEMRKKERDYLPIIYYDPRRGRYYHSVDKKEYLIDSAYFVHAKPIGGTIQ